MKDNLIFRLTSLDFYLYHFAKIFKTICFSREAILFTSLPAQTCFAHHFPFKDSDPPVQDISLFSLYNYNSGAFDKLDQSNMPMRLNKNPVQTAAQTDSYVNPARRHTPLKIIPEK